LDTSSSKILMADDDGIVRRIVVAKLSGLGYDMIQAEDGREALGFLENGFVPDLVITDSLMPRMTGLGSPGASGTAPTPTRPNSRSSCSPPVRASTTS
jgi:DNA-binding NtrC family response regulator